MAYQNVETTDTPNAGRAKWNANDTELYALVGVESIKAANVQPANSAAANRTNLLNALNSSTKTYYVGPGDYQVDNATALTVTGFGGMLLFAPGASLVYSDNTKGGLNFSAGTGARIVGMNYRYATSAPAQVDAQDGLRFTATTDSRVVNLHGQGSPSIGVQFIECVRPSLLGRTYVHDQRRDGVHFANCQDIMTGLILVDNVGDDAVGISNLATLANYSGATIGPIRAYSNAGAALAVYGQSDVLAESGIYGENTHGALIRVSGRDATWNFRDPQNVVIDGGLGVDSGKGPQMANLQGDDFRSGVVIYRDVDPTLTGEMDVTVKNIEIHSPYHSGIFALIREGEIHLENIHHVGGGAGRGILVAAPRYTVKDCSTDGSNGYGAQLADATRGDVDGLTIRNSSVTNTDRRALSVEQNSNSPATASRVTCRRVRIIDDQATTTGYNTVGYSDASKTLDVDFGEIEYDLSAVLSAAAVQSFSAQATVRSSRRYVRQGTQRSLQTAAPTSGYWQVGDKVYNSAPAAAGVIGWVCTTAGAPGTWKTFGTIQA